MAHGGSRPGAGRKVGSLTTKTREIAEKAADGGLMPLEYMLQRLRDETLDSDARFEAAKQAAPYVHPKLSSIESKVDASVEAMVHRIERVVVDPADSTKP